MKNHFKVGIVAISFIWIGALLGNVNLISLSVGSYITSAILIITAAILWTTSEDTNASSVYIKRYRRVRIKLDDFENATVEIGRITKTTTVDNLLAGALGMTPKEIERLS